MSSVRSNDTEEGGKWRSNGTVGKSGLKEAGVAGIAEETEGAGRSLASQSVQLSLL